MIPRIFVAGASGYTGQAVVGAATARGWRVVAHLRPGSASADACVARFERSGAVIDRTPWVAEALRAAVVAHAPDVVFGLLGTTRARGAAARKAGAAVESYETVDLNLTLMLLQAASACDPPPRFVYLSSMGAECPGGNAYLRARFAMEQALRASAVPFTVARPAIISGVDRAESRLGERVGARLGDAALTAVGWLGGGRLRDRMSSMTAEMLADGLLRAAIDPAAVGQVWDAERLRRS